MKNLFLIRRPHTNNSTFRFLHDEATSKGIQVHDLNFDNFDFSNIPQLTKDDGVYSISFDNNTRLVEKSLINEQAVSFYTDYKNCVASPDNVLEATMILEKEMLPIIPTIFALSKSKERLMTYVDALSGFPVIIKNTGGSHGKGVMKIDSLSSLTSVCDYLLSQNQTFILRKFIPHKKQGRLIVLGDKVVASHENYAALDFRSNVGPNALRTRGVVQYNSTICEMAVNAVKALNLEFGGVDVLLDERDETPYIAEVNFPCYFPTTQRLTGIDIAGEMIDHLVKKSEDKPAFMLR